MALTLAEAAKLSQDDLQRGVIETFVQVSPILDRIPFLTIEGNAYAYNEEATLPGVEFRAVNAAYSESTGTVNPKSERLVILGGDADVDTFIVQTRGNLTDQRATQTAMKVKAASYKYQDTFINGDSAVDVNAFDGLKKRLTGGQVIAGGTNGIPVVGNGTTDPQTFFDGLDALVALVPGLSSGSGALYANSKIIGKIRSAGRRLGGVETVREDMTGKRIITWNGIPLLDLGQTAAGADILPLTETQGTAVDASSIYAVKFGQDEGDQAVTGLTNGGVQTKDLGEIDAKPVYRTRIEFFCGLGVFGGKAAARLTGVRNQ
ncbi:major capsid protein [Catellatospora sp. NPDC049609]|uniref:major capsid protein n=1 Tax=Catellatospora sp. NPDC049609 TaxID=3155505 RepID=UPI0034131F08